MLCTAIKAMRCMLRGHARKKILNIMDRVDAQAPQNGIASRAM